MAYVDPFVRPQFDALPFCVQEAVLAMGTRVETGADLAGCLARMAARHRRENFFEYALANRAKNAILLHRAGAGPSRLRRGGGCGILGTERMGRERL